MPKPPGTPGGGPGGGKGGGGGSGGGGGQGGGKPPGTPGGGGGGGQGGGGGGGNNAGRAVMGNFRRVMGMIADETKRRKYGTLKHGSENRKMGGGMPHGAAKTFKGFKNVGQVRRVKV